MMMAAYCISFDQKNCPLSNRVSTSAGPVEVRAPAPAFVLVARPPEICLGNWEAFFFFLKCWLRSEAGQVGVEKLARHLLPNYSKHHLSVAQAIPCSLTTAQAIPCALTTDMGLASSPLQLWIPYGLEFQYCSSTINLSPDTPLALHIRGWMFKGLLCNISAVFLLLVLKG